MQVDDLAIFGGDPAFHDALHVGRPNIGNRAHLLTRINDMLDRYWLSNMGPYVQSFEEQVAQRLGVKHCIAISSGTVALEIAIRAAELHGEVIIPSFTFIATAHALQWQAITPIFCDIEPETHSIDTRKVEQLITPKTTGIIGVHLWGKACDIEALSKIAQAHNLRLLFDAAHAFACSHKGVMIGNFGDAEVFSFHATKILNTFEGGAVVTNDDELASKIRLMQNFGFAGYDNVIYIGTNGKMSEISAAMGLTGLENLEEFISINYRNYKQYSQELQGVPGVTLLTYDEFEKNNYHYIVLDIDESSTHISRDQILQVLHKENILIRRYFYPGCHRMEPYRSYFPHAGLLLPETEKLAGRLLCLPTGTAIGEDEIHDVCSMIRFVVKYGYEIRKKMENYFP